MMSIGSVLIGLAVLAVLAAYLARPFRSTAGAGVNQTIEAWVTQVQLEEAKPTASDDEEELGESAREEAAPEAINYCPQCGRAVDENDRFCSGCGTRLGRGTT